MKKQYINRKGELVYLDDDDGIVPDGYGVRTSIHLMDGADDVQRAIAASTHHRITDSAGRLAGHRPGFLLDNSNDELQARISHDAMVARAQSNWRGPNATSISDATTPEASREAYIKHTEQSWRTPVQARYAYGGHVTIPGGDDNDVELARKKYIDGLQNAWRTCKGIGFGPGSFGG